MPKGLKTFLISIVVVGAFFAFCWWIGGLGWLADRGLPGGLETKLEGLPIPGNFALVNRVGAKNPTYDELVDFIKKDQTDKTPYKMYEYSCLDYARDVHNNAEAAGIRAGLVIVNPNAEWDINRHALNVFDTVDEGLVFIDCTRYDTRAYVSIGEYYDIEPLYPGVISDGFLFSFAGTVKKYKIYWWQGPSRMGILDELEKLGRAHHAQLGFEPPYLTHQLAKFFATALPPLALLP